MTQYFLNQTDGSPERARSLMEMYTFVYMNMHARISSLLFTFCYTTLYVIMYILMHSTPLLSHTNMHLSPSHFPLTTWDTSANNDHANLHEGGIVWRLDKNWCFDG